MAPSAWANAALRLILEVASFLLSDSSPLCPCESLVTTLDSLKTSPKTQNFVDRLLTSLATSLGLTMPTALSVYSGLPLATAYILKLTEIVPPEFVLWLIVCGLVSCLLVIFGSVLVAFLIIGRLVYKIAQLFYFSIRLLYNLFGVRNFSFSRRLFSRTTSRPAIATSHRTALTNDTPPTLSNAARMLAPSLAANQSSLNLRPRRPRRPCQDH